MQPPAVPPSTFAELVNFFIEFINSFILLLIGLAFVFTVWNIISSWIIHSDNDTKREEGKHIAFNSVVVMVVMICIWGILTLLKNSLL